ncbi:MAG: non-canonical purine NTP pyrophosphatase [Clostridiales bacterium]|jgi:XTP/dITP diphosphohydrolase|nr:non-canonical purine NTP pyrophosphatase [Clostridiales bacterium]
MNLILATNNKHKAVEIKEILRDKFSRIYTLKEAGINVDPEENGASFFENALIKAKAVFGELSALLTDEKTDKKTDGGEKNYSLTYAERLQKDISLPINSEISKKINAGDFPKISGDLPFLKAPDAKTLKNTAVLADDSGLCVDFLDGAPGIFSARYAGEHCSYEDNNKKLLTALKNAKNRGARFVCAVVLLFSDGSYLVGNGSSEGEILRESSGENGFGYDPIFYSHDLKKTFSEADGEEKNAVSHRGRALADLLNKLN